MRRRSGLRWGCLVTGLAGLGVSAPAEAAESCRDAVIDVHLHAYEQDVRLANAAPNPANPAKAAAADGSAHREALLRELRANGVVRGLIASQGRSAGEAAVEASGGLLRLGYAITDIPTAAQLREIRALHDAGKIVAIGEVETPYAGIGYDDPRLEPLWALAESLGLPVLLHTGSGPPDAYRARPRNRDRFGEVLALEDVLVRHPHLKVVLQHMGWPMLDATVAMLNSYTQVYVDVAAIDWLIPAPEFHAYLKRLVDAGFGRRILFGSDAMVWPEAIGLAIEGVRSASFLGPAQKEDILFGNARRFFGWNDLTCAG